MLLYNTIHTSILLSVVKICISMDKTILDELDRYRGLVSRSAIIGDILNKNLIKGGSKK